MAASKKVNSRKGLVDHALEIARKARADAVNIPKKPVSTKGKKTVPTVLDWGSGIPNDKLAYLNDEEMALIQAHRMFKGKRSYNGIPAFPDPGDTAAGDTGQGTSSSAGLGNNTSTSSSSSSSSGYGSQNVSGSSLNSASNNNGYGGSSSTSGGTSSGSSNSDGASSTSSTGSSPGSSNADASSASSTSGGSGSASDTTSDGTSSAVDNDQQTTAPTATGPTDAPARTAPSAPMPGTSDPVSTAPSSFSTDTAMDSIANGSSIVGGYPSNKMQDRVPQDPSRMTTSTVDYSQNPTVPQSTGVTSNPVSMSNYANPSLDDATRANAFASPNSSWSSFNDVGDLSSPVSPYSSEPSYTSPDASSFMSQTPTDDGYADVGQPTGLAPPSAPPANGSMGMSFTPSIPAPAVGLGGITREEADALYGDPDLADIPTPEGTSPYNTDPTPGSSTPASSTPASPSVIYSGYADPNVAPQYADAVVGNQYGYPGFNNTPTTGNSNVNVSGAGYPTVSASSYANPNLSAQSTNDVFGNTTGFPRTTAPASAAPNVANSGPPGMTPNSALPTTGVPGFSSPLPPDSGMTYNPNIPPAAPSAAASVPAPQSMPPGYQYDNPLPDNSGMTYNSSAELAALNAANAAAQSSIPAPQSMTSGYQYGNPMPDNSGMTYNSSAELAALDAANRATQPTTQSSSGMSYTPPTPTDSQFVGSAKQIDDRLFTTPDGETYEVSPEQYEQLSPEEQARMDETNQRVVHIPASSSEEISSPSFGDTGVRKTVNPYTGGAASSDEVNIDNVDPDAPPTDRYIGPTYPGDEEPSPTATASNKNLPEDVNSSWESPEPYTEPTGKTPLERRRQRRKRQQLLADHRRGQEPLPEYVPYDYLKTDYGIPAEPDPDIVAFNNYSSTLKRGGRVGNSIDAALRLARQSVVSRNKTR